ASTEPGKEHGPPSRYVAPVFLSPRNLRGERRFVKWIREECKAGSAKRAVCQRPWLARCGSSGRHHANLAGTFSYADNDRRSAKWWQCANALGWRAVVA